MKIGQLDPIEGVGLIIDTNLLVLFVVGAVNRDRIETFKRTRSYSKADYDLLVRVLECFKNLYTVAHVAAEVSNLTDLSGTEQLRARAILAEVLELLNEPVMASVRAARNPRFARLGLADAAIEEVAREHKCTVLTDDLDLYVALEQQGIPALNFTHLRAQAWGL